MQLSVANQGYLVYVTFGILIAVTPFVLIELPISITNYNQAFYDVFEEAPEGSWIVSIRTCHYFTVDGGLRGVNEAWHKHVLYDKGLKIFLINVGVGHGQEQLPSYTFRFYEEFFEVPLNEAPIYGSQIVYLGYVPIPQENAYTSLRDNIFAIKDTDYWGTPLASMPMFTAEDAISSWNEAYAITDIQEIAIAMFPEQKKVDIMDDSWISYGAAFFTSGQIDGFIGGMRGGAEYEKLTGYLGANTLVMTQSFFSAGYVVILVIAGSVLYLVRRGGGSS
jgi:hypothetical protein